MKKTKTLFWITTGLLFLFEGVMPALTGRSQMSIASFTHLGYPLYFVTLLTVAKVLGALALIIPQVSPRIKEWAYAGFGIDFTSAFVSIVAVDGWNGTLVIPIIAALILILSYKSYHKLQSAQV